MDVFLHRGIHSDHLLQKGNIQDIIYKLINYNLYIPIM